MSVAFILRTLFELFLVVAVFWGIFNEDKLIFVEKQIALALRHREKQNNRRNYAGKIRVIK